MKISGKIKKTLVLVAISFAVALVFVRSPVSATSWSLLPPAIAIFMAFVSHHVGLGLGAAILMGGFLSFYGESGQVLSSLFGMLQNSGGVVYQAGADKTNLQILGFVFFIFTTVQVMTKSGGLRSLVDFFKGWIVGPRSAQMMTALLGCFVFIDDYANTMIVGPTMRSLTDRYKVSRQKLAFLVDATSAPIAGVALVSTWVGYEVGLFDEMVRRFSWPIDGYGVFLEAIGFRFYCFMMLLFVFINSFFNFDFGPMKDYQQSLVGSGEEDSKGATQKSSILCALVPLTTLLVLVFSFLWYDGGGFSKNPLSFVHWKEVLTASRNGVFILFLSSVITYPVALIIAFVKSSFGFRDFFKTLLVGLKRSGTPVGILILAWSLKSICDDLKTAEFIVMQLGDKLSLQTLPMLVFVVSSLTAFAIGTSWGTMAILIPTITPLAVTLNGGDYGVFVSLSLAAILDGAIMGDHCSPISDTTIMSAMATECDLMSHVRTQLPYSLVVGFLALFTGYLPAGYGVSPLVSLGLSFVLMVALFFCLKRLAHRRKKATI